MGLKKSKKLKVGSSKNKQTKSSNKPAVGKSIKNVVNTIKENVPFGELIQYAPGFTAGKNIKNALTGKKGKTGKKKRKGKIPKQVKRWASRIVSRRKQEEKLVKELFGAGGGKVVKAPKKGSAGVITREEALRSLRN